MKKIFIILCIFVSSILFMNYVDARNVNMTVSGVHNYDYEHQVLDIVNEERAKNNLEPLVLDNSLTEKAMIRAAEIYDKFEHIRPNNTSCFSILNDIIYTTAGENIAAGQSNASSVMNSWMNSEGHRANILNSDFKAIGIGHINVGGRNYWVQLFTDKPQVEFTKIGTKNNSITFEKDESELEDLYNIVKSTFNIDNNNTIKLNNTNKSINLLRDSRKVNINNYKSIEIPISSYYFYSLNNSVASVDSNGLVTAVGNGYGVIRVYYGSNYYNFNIEVTGLVEF